MSGKYNLLGRHLGRREVLALRAKESVMVSRLVDRLLVARMVAEDADIVVNKRSRAKINAKCKKNSAENSARVSVNDLPFN